jgi:hypothetical protein
MGKAAAKAPVGDAAPDSGAGRDVRPEVSLYDRDFYAWTQEQGRLVREGRFSDLDCENIAEELETLGRSQKNEIRSRLRVVLMHLLKWRHQSSRRSNSWRATLLDQREEIAHELKDSPSLRSYPGLVLNQAYRIARLDASGETKLLLETFPEACPFTIEQILDPDFLPDAGAT